MANNGDIVVIMDSGFNSKNPYASCKLPAAEIIPKSAAPVISDPSGLWGIDGSIVLYGIIADILLIVPLLMYLLIADAASNNELRAHHMTYINMLYSAYAPLGISWWIVLADDSEHARTVVRTGVEQAGLGPYALLWVGMTTWFMQYKDSYNYFATLVLIEWIWAIIYPVVNILLIVTHYHLSPPMYAWLEKAPMKANPIDDPTPWSAPSQYKTSVTTDAVQNLLL